MKRKRGKSWAIKLCIIGTSLWFGSLCYGGEIKNHLEVSLGSGKSFLYTAKSLGIPILKASLKIENGVFEQGKPSYQVQIHLGSFQNLRPLLRINNCFTSIIDSETLQPLRYMKEIDQKGVFIKDKHYYQILTFDCASSKVIERTDKKGEQEIFLPPHTYDPLSIFAKYYLREEILPGQELRMSIYDGVKLREMVFRTRKEPVRSKIYGKVEAICLESTTSFSNFADQEGVIRIWYLSDRRKTPLLMELDLPIGKVRFELEKVEENGRLER
jgi:hypothetical protein